ncbi:hypothetical protein ACA097_27810 [Pseudomonas sp. QL9]|uniref:hypothetical protein n=1 Tax=Pseudomonas sp. QL9 TaxID=3242725 RepID=UPI00352B824F
MSLEQITSYTLFSRTLLFWLGLLIFIALIVMRYIDNPGDRKRKSRIYRVGVVSLVLLISWGWRSIFINPLPSDDELISYFQKNRLELEVLISAYYGAAEDGMPWDAPYNLQKLEARIGIERIHPAHGPWPPDPYSVEWAKWLGRVNYRNAEDRFAVKQYRALQIDLSDRRYRQVALRYPFDYLIWKSLFYIPAVARTSDSKLWPPVTWIPLRPQTKEAYERSAERILQNLTGYPENWRKGECVYRQLDVHWFILMCRAT